MAELISTNGIRESVKRTPNAAQAWKHIPYKTFGGE
jgi:hypothetical protein